MKITFVSTLLTYWGGSEVLWVRCLEEAVAQGHDVQLVIFAQENGYHPAIEKMRTSIKSFVEIPNLTQNVTYITKAIASIKAKVFPFRYNEILQFNADAIFVNQPDTYTAAFNPIIETLLLKTQKPYYLLSQFNSEHDCLSYADILKVRRVFKKAKAIYFVSKRNWDVAEHQLAMKIENGGLIGNHPDIKAFHMIVYPAGSDVINFASVARLDSKFKGQDILLQILSSKKWNDRNWRLNFYGTGPDESYLKELTEYYNLSDRVFFLGHVSDLEDVWTNNHILLMPSTAEGKPLALAEAMACGRTAVVSDVAGNGELIENGVNGFLASSYFVEPFDEALERAWAGKKNWADMGRKARQKVLDTIDSNPQQTLLDFITQI
jgi:glycosyltransferase involved in cell wall biosynthesis